MFYLFWFVLIFLYFTWIYMIFSDVLWCFLMFSDFILFYSIFPALYKILQNFTAIWTIKFEFHKFAYVQSWIDVLARQLLWIRHNSHYVSNYFAIFLYFLNSCQSGLPYMARGEKCGKSALRWLCHHYPSILSITV